MKIALYGGFGEKGRTCLGVEAHGTRLLLDAGIKTSAHGRDDYYPAVPDAHLRDAAAIVLTHAHEDHVGALGRFVARGFRGRMFMTERTQADCAPLIAAYSGDGDEARLHDTHVEPLPVGGDPVSIGTLRVGTGRSGHIAGGVWCVVDDGERRFGYCGDMACESPVFAMDRMPPCDALAIDASYGDDDTGFAARAARIAAWADAHPEGSVLPTPQFGRSLELFAVLRGRCALAPGMREAIAAQLAATSWLRPGVAGLARDLDHVPDWSPRDPLPRLPVLCHDGMGLQGPSRDILARAEAQGWAVLLTGHLPEASPGERLYRLGRADWLRMPTHPTLHENLAIVAGTGAALALGHSCDPTVLAGLAAHLPQLRRAATGDTIEIA